MSRLTRELTGYGAASLCALIVDALLLWIFVRFLGLGYLAAATLSFLAGACVAYFLSVRLAFTRHRLRDRRAEFLSFVAIGMVGLAVNGGIMAAGVKVLGLHYLVAKLVAAGCTFFCNFAVRRRILFVDPTMHLQRPAQ